MIEKVEYRELFDLNPVLLAHADLLSLEKLLIEDSSTDRIKIVVSFDSTSVSAGSFDELFSNHELPLSTDKLSISMQRWIDTEDYKGISSGVHLKLHYNHINCQVHSIDQTWYLGKKTQIEKYFRSKVPWYSFLNRLAPAYPTIAIVLFIYGTAEFAREQYIDMILPIVTSVVLALITFLVLKQKLFPFVKIRLKEPQKLQFGFYEWCALVGVFGSVATLVQVVSTIFK